MLKIIPILILSQALCFYVSSFVHAANEDVEKWFLRFSVGCVLLGLYYIMRKLDDANGKGK